jgi:hypothetical protein
MSEVHHRVSKQKFFHEKDEQLRHLASIHGENSWHLIAAELGNRLPRQCKERWKLYLSPSVTQSPWTPDDDRSLKEKVNERGKCWKALESFFPGRTNVALKNRYKVLERKNNRNRKIMNNMPLKNSRKKTEVNFEAAETPDKASDKISKVEDSVDHWEWSLFFSSDFE